jgi:hypothetical protein
MVVVPKSECFSLYLKFKNKNELLKVLQANLNKLIKEYDNLSLNNSNEINVEIRKLETENAQLNQRIKSTIQTNNGFPPLGSLSNSATNGTAVLSFANTSFNGIKSKDIFDDIFSSNLNSQQPKNGQQNPEFAIEDPFKAFDPFKDNNNDPFSSSQMSKTTSRDFLSDGLDPFANSFDPFKIANANAANSPTNNDQKAMGFTTDDPFGEKKTRPPPPRPAPPRPQTPSLKPTKSMETSQRPQSALDFTRNNKLDLFNDFSDSFQANPNSSANQTTNIGFAKGVCILIL